MDIDKEYTNKSNRRSAFRIYEQVNLLYKKIESDSKEDAKLDVNHVLDNASQSLDTKNFLSDEDLSPEDFLPESHSQENDTLNVNISSSGISFTCKEELVPDDYLMIRILLLSSMTVITTCCKVIYLKPSNPFEKNRYPYLVGTHFVNLKPEDEELLNRHVSKQITQQFIVKGLLASLIMSILVMPDQMFDFVVGGGAFLLDNLVEIAHVLYELIEYSLDLFVEYVFHTDLHETEIIVFYIQVVLGGVGLYAFLRIISSVFKKLFFHCRVFFRRKKSSLLYLWGEQSLLYRVGIISLGVIVALCYVLFFI